MEHGLHEVEDGVVKLLSHAVVLRGVCRRHLVVDAVVSEVVLEAGVLVLTALVGVEHMYVAPLGVGHQESVEGIWHFVLGADELNVHIVSAVIYK